MLIIATFVLAGCFTSTEEVSISPLPRQQDQADVGLGPGVRPLSSGPGEKGSPSWRPSDDRIAFTVDGYVVDKSPGAQDFRRLTTKDFGAQTVAWVSSGRSLAILGADSSTAPQSRLSQRFPAVYETVTEDDSLDVTRIAAEVRYMVPIPGDRRLLLALAEGDSDSRLALVEPGGEVLPYSEKISGEVTGASFSTDGAQAVLAVRSSGLAERFELRAFSLADGSSREIASLEKGLEVFGAPQWTTDGIYYVAGEETDANNTVAASYELYRLSPGADTPEPAPGVGKGFVALNLRRDPGGERLAVIGRRNASSPINLYVLDLTTSDLEAVTSNEDMEIKTDAEDLAWSANGDSVVVVARTDLSEPEVYSSSADNLVSAFYNLYEVPASPATAVGST